MKLKSLLILPLAFLVACGKDSSDGSNELSTEVNQMKDLSESDGVIKRVFDIESLVDLEDTKTFIQYIQSLNKKIIEFRLSKNQVLQEDCYTKSENTNVTTLKKENGIVNVFVQLTKNKTTRSIVNCPIIENGQIEIKNFRIIPDILVNQKLNNEIYLWATNQNSFDHVILTDVVYIGSNQLTINAKKIIFNRSQIRTFPDYEMTAEDRHDGLNGGELLLNSSTILGSVKFNLFGQNGGEIPDLPPKIETIIPEDPTLNGNCKKDCRGRPGKQGFPGEQGYNGRKGGDSGSITLKFNKSLGLDIDVLLRAGDGSRGGFGGEGGPGQIGGVNQERVYEPDPLDICRPTCVKIPYEEMRRPSRAATGPKGPRGKRGDDGQSGTIITSKIIYKNQETLLETNSRLNFGLDYE